MTNVTPACVLRGHTAITLKLVQDYKFTPQQAELIEAFVYEQLRWSGDCLNTWEDYADIFRQVVDAGK